MGNMPPGDTLAIIGGGVIGVELTSVYLAMGKSVLLLEAMERLLPLMDRELSQNLSMILKKRGAEIYTGATVTRVVRASKLILSVDIKDTEIKLACDSILVATGRLANTENLFRCPPPEIRRGFFVDDYFMTTVPGVYAVGDAISGSSQLAHAATAQGIAFAEKLCDIYEGDGLEAIPSCVYTDPEIASVGLTAEEAKARGLPVLQGKAVFGGNARALIAGSERSFVKLIFNGETHRLLGAQLMCSRAGEMINECTAALLRGDRAEEMRKVVRPHPSFGEAITAAAEAALEK
jgi:dihydrolipoamide dehydrogenase